MRAEFGRQRILRGILAWITFAVAVGIVAAVIGFVVFTLLPPKFTASATVLVTPSSEDADVGDLDLALRLTPTFAELATTTPILQGVIEELQLATDPDQLRSSVSTNVPALTSLITISASHDDAAASARIVNAIAERLIAFPRADTTTGTPPAQVSLLLVDPATQPGARGGIGLLGTIVLAASFGVLVAFTIAYLIENLRQEP